MCIFAGIWAARVMQILVRRYGRRSSRRSESWPCPAAGRLLGRGPHGWRSGRFSGDRGRVGGLSAAPSREHNVQDMKRAVSSGLRAGRATVESRIHAAGRPRPPAALQRAEAPHHASRSAYTWTCTPASRHATPVCRRSSAPPACVTGSTQTADFIVMRDPDGNESCVVDHPGQ